MEEMVVEALFNGDREAQIMAAGELSKMNSNKRKKIAEKGVILPLISMLSFDDDDEVIEAALNALLSLAFGSERNKTRIARSGAIPVILRLLQCPTEELLDLAMAALLTLSSCTANKLAIASSGAVQVLVECIDSDNPNSITLQAKLDAIATLHNLSTCNEIIPLMITSGIVCPLLQLIHGSEKTSDLVYKATSLLERLVSSSEDALQETANTGWAIQVLVAVIEDGFPQSKEHAVTVLFFICRICRDTYRGLILQEGAMPGLLQLSVDGTQRAKDVAKDLLRLLRDGDNRRGVRSKKQLQNELRMEQIMDEIDSTEEERVTGNALRLVEQMISDFRV